MCGIAGFVGVSKDKRFTYNLAKNIFKKLEIRGIHASGVYATDTSNNIYFDKQPITSSSYVNTNFFKNLENKNLNICMMHTRQATPMCGDPEDNRNNHPFVSADGKKILMHNGMVDREEYDNLVSVFATESSCDSEVLLRFMEKNNDKTIDSFSKLCGLTTKSQFAISYIELNDHVTNLYLIRNHARPLYVFDLRESLGQIFFCSTNEIFLQAICKMRGHQEIMNKCVFKRVMPYKLYNYSLSDDNINTSAYSIKLYREVITEYE